LAQDVHEQQTGPFVQTAMQGPVNMSVSIQQDRITPAGRLNLVVEVSAPNGVQISMPSPSERTTGFAIRERREHPPEPTGEGRLWRQEYLLGALRLGEQTIPKLTATFIDLRQGPDSAAEGEVTTGELTLTVEPLLASDVDPSAFRDIKGPLPLASSPTRRWLGYTTGVLVAVVVLATVFVRLTHRRREQPQVTLSPHEWALAQLQALVGEQFIERGLVREFYFRLNMVVRQYLAKQFHVMALEWTTEELLQELQRSTALSAGHQKVLSPFLAACDMVKFAHHTPGAEEIDGTFNAARDFVDQSAGIALKEVTTA